VGSWRSSLRGSLAAVVVQAVPLPVSHGSLLACPRSLWFPGFRRTFPARRALLAWALPLRPWVRPPGSLGFSVAELVQAVVQRTCVPAPRPAFGSTSPLRRRRMPLRATPSMSFFFPSTHAETVCSNPAGCHPAESGGGAPLRVCRRRSARPGFVTPLRASSRFLAELVSSRQRPWDFIPSEVCSCAWPDTFRLALPFLPLATNASPWVSSVGRCRPLEDRQVSVRAEQLRWLLALRVSGCPVAGGGRGRVAAPFSAPGFKDSSTGARAWFRQRLFTAFGHSHLSWASCPPGIR